MKLLSLATAMVLLLGLGPAGTAFTHSSPPSPGIDVSHGPGNVTVEEGGATDTVSFKLKTDPHGVTVTVTMTDLSSPDQVTVSPTTLTFTHSNYNSWQSVTITAVDDSLIEGDHSTTIRATSSSNYGGGVHADQDVDIVDNDKGLIIEETGGSTDLAEGSSAKQTYKIHLSQQPSNTVTVTVTPDSQVTVNDSTDPITLTFHEHGGLGHHRWDSDYTVEVRAVDDLIVEGTPHYGYIDHSCSGGGFTGVTATVTANIADNDTGSLVITESGGSTDVVEGGDTDTYTVALGKQPASDVNVYLAPDIQVTVEEIDGSELLGVVPETTPGTFLTFTPADWDVAQTIQVTAVDDLVVEGEHSGVIHHTCDGLYAGVTADVDVDITDNDHGGVVLSANDELGLGVDEEGPTSDILYVKLSMEPAESVTVQVTCDDQVTIALASPDDYEDGLSASGEVIVAPSVFLDFNPCNWDSWQFVEVTAVDDLIVEGTPHWGHVYAQALGDYDGDTQTVDVRITDNDAPVVVIDPTHLDLAEGGSSGTYTVALGKEPAGEVTVSIGHDGQVSVDASTLTFTPDDYATPQTVTVTAVDDSVYEGSHSSTITHSVSGDGYAGVAADDVTVDITDNDPRPKQEEEDECCNPPALRGPWASFLDMAGHWAHDDVILAATLQIATGAPGGYYNPEGTITRAEFLAMLQRTMGCPNAITVMPYSDVPATHPYYADILKAVKCGTAIGYADGTFRPDQAITREEAGAMLAKALIHCGAKPVTSSYLGRQIIDSRFVDGDEVTEGNVRAIALVVYHEMLLGRENNELKPQADLTRAEAAAMMVRFWRWLRGM